MRRKETLITQTPLLTVITNIKPFRLPCKKEEQLALVVEPPKLADILKSSLGCSWNSKSKANEMPRLLGNISF